MTRTIEQTTSPLGTPKEFRRLHTIIRRVCYVLLFGLVLEGALTFPLLAIWYGVPTLSPAEVCNELQKVMYSDESRTCKTADLNSPPLGGTGEAQNADHRPGRLEGPAHPAVPPGRASGSSWRTSVSVRPARRTGG